MAAPAGSAPREARCGGRFSSPRGILAGAARSGRGGGKAPPGKRGERARCHPRGRSSLTLVSREHVDAQHLALPPAGKALSPPLSHARPLAPRHGALAPGARLAWPRLLGTCLAAGGDSLPAPPGLPQT